MKGEVVKVLEKALKEKGIKLSKEEIASRIEIPPNVEMGDYSFPCFSLVEKLKDSPHQIALEIREKIGTPQATEFDDIQVQGPYINFFLDRKDLARKAVFEAITEKKNYGKSKDGRGKKIVFEFSSPNIAKHFGIGHLRSTIMGNSLSNIAEFLGYRAVRINYYGDWGASFGKIIFGYKKFGNDEALLKDPLDHLTKVYIKANSKKYEKPSSEWFKKLEDRDKEALMLWKVFRERSIEEFQKIYKDLGIKFDFFSSESQSVKKSKEILTQLEKKKLITKSKGALIVDLKKYNLDVLIMVKTDGATTYALRDIAEAIERYKKYKFTKMIYEVGHEQEMYLRQIFKIIELMGYKWAEDCIHVSHGLYLGKDNKKFSTRKGRTFYMKDILKEIEKFAAREIRKRERRISNEELAERAHKLAIASIFYSDLKNSRKNDVVFDPAKFVSFEGNTGPYILYSYARASSIIRKSQNPSKFEINELSQKELELVKKIIEFKDIVKSSFESMNPAVIANFSYELAKNFNEFYHECPVIGSEKESFRLALVEAFRVVLKNSLNLLGIEILQKM